MKCQGDVAEAFEEKFDSKPTLRVVPGKSGRRKNAEITELVLGHRENGRKLARSILRRWRVRMPADEIDSIVDLALCEAARRYTTGRGATFMTFFFYHLRGHLVRSVTRAAQASNLFMAYSQNSGIDATEWRRIGSDSAWSYVPDHFLFGQRDIMTPENEILRKEKIMHCRDAVAQLDDLEREIIERSFAGEQALVDIARSLGYSRCHISRVKKSALSRLKTIIGGSEYGEQSAPTGKNGKDSLVERTVLERALPKRRSRRRSISGRNRPIAHSSKSKAA